jgi:hypothetical protein
MGKNSPPKVVAFQWFIVFFTPLDIILLGFANLLPPLSHLLHACKPFSGFACHLQHLKRSIFYSLPYVIGVFPFSKCLLPLNCKTPQFVGGYFLILTLISTFNTRCYLLLTTNHLPLQRLLKWCASYFLFLKNVHYHVRGGHNYLYNLQLSYFPHLLVE